MLPAIEHTSAAAIEAEIIALEQRCDQLQAQHAAPPILGQTNFTERRAGLDEVAAIEAELLDLRAALVDAQAHEAQQAKLAGLLDLAAAGTTALRDIEQIRRAFDKAIVPLLEKYSAAVQRQSAARRAFYAELGTLDPAELGGADLRGVLSNLVDFRDKLHDVPYVFEHDYPGSLKTALREEASRRVPLWPDTVVHTLPERNKPHD